MRNLTLPPFPAKIKSENGKTYIYDILRRKYVILSPEEWVRQHFTNFLIDCKNYPKSMLANEVSIRLNATSKRCDTVVYNRFLEPKAIIEYKAPSVEITQATFEQIMRYNMVLHVQYLFVSNGIRHICCKIDYENGQFSFLEEIPTYEQVVSE